MDPGGGPSCWLRDEEAAGKQGLVLGGLLYLLTEDLRQALLSDQGHPEIPTRHPSDGKYKCIQ
jgi:hypothetical protein